MTALQTDHRLSPRVDVDLRAAFRQSKRVGGWEVLDLSKGGFCATGDLAGLDPERPVHVRLGTGESGFHVLAVLTWTRDLGDESWPIHGWSFVSMSDTARMDLAALLAAPPKREFTPPPLPNPEHASGPSAMAVALAVVLAAAAGAVIALALS